MEDRYEESEKLYRETLEIRRRVLGPEHPNTLTSIAELATTLLDEERYAEAEKLTREELEIGRRIFGADHPGTLVSMSLLASVLEREGHYPEAEKLYRETLAIRQRVLGPKHYQTLVSMDGLADTLMREGHYSEAEKLYRTALALNPPEHIAFVTYKLACLAAHQGRREQALSLLGEALDHGLQPNLALELERDEDLKPLYGDPRFDALVAHAKEAPPQPKKKQ